MIRKNIIGHGLFELEDMYYDGKVVQIQLRKYFDEDTARHKDISMDKQDLQDLHKLLSEYLNSEEVTK